MLVSIHAAKGSPGVTTTSLALTWALAQLNPSSVAMAECDPSGGDLCCWFPDVTESGLLALAAESSSSSNEVALGPDLSEHVNDLGAHGLRAVTSPSDAAATEMALHALGPEPALRLARAASVVVADCGRSVSADATSQVARSADAVLVVCRPTLASVEHTRTLVEHLRPRASRLALLVVCNGPYPPHEVAEAIATPLAGHLPWDPRGVRALLGLTTARAWPRSQLAHAALALARSLGPAVHCQSATSAADA